MYFDPTDKFSSLNHKKITIYFCMSLMVEPNIVFLAQNEVIFEKMMGSSKNTCQNAHFLCISKLPTNNYLRAKFCDQKYFLRNMVKPSFTIDGKAMKIVSTIENSVNKTMIVSPRTLESYCSLKFLLSHSMLA